MNGHVAIIGCGNIGSVLCDLLARQPEVHRLTLVDPGSYDASNVRTQAIVKSEIGLPKVLAQQRRIKRIRPDLQISTYQAEVESLPLGALKADVICACLDSRISRMAVNEAAWRLGVTGWIDAGVNASKLLARVDLFLPSLESPCLECSWGEQHYATLEVRHPCQNGQTPTAPPTNAPAYLGGLAASLQAAVCHKLLCGRKEELHAGEQVLYGLDNHQQFVSRNRRNSDCKFDHKVFAPQEISGRLSLKDLLFPTQTGDSSDGVSLYVPGQKFLRREPCRHCGHTGTLFECIRTGVGLDMKCRFCGKKSPIHPWLLQERLTAHEIPTDLLMRPPSALGLRVGDLIGVESRQGERYYLLGRTQIGCNQIRKGA